MCRLARCYSIETQHQPRLADTPDGTRTSPAGRTPVLPRQPPISSHQAGRNDSSWAGATSGASPAPRLNQGAGPLFPQFLRVGEPPVRMFPVDSQQPEV